MYWNSRCLTILQIMDIYVFKDIDDALKRLNKHSIRFKNLPNQNLKTKTDIITLSVTKNIFRALGTENHKPSEVYRAWASLNFERLLVSLNDSGNQGEFDTVVKIFTDDLLHTWNRVTKERLVYGPASKIVNLLIKKIQESGKFRMAKIIPFQHIPWDSYTLRPLRKIINEISDTSYSINISSLASMSFVNNPQLYDTLQYGIFNLYKRLNNETPTIYFDYFAWDDNH
jgi:hypothetical protein